MTAMAAKIFLAAVLVSTGFAAIDTTVFNASKYASKAVPQVAHPPAGAASMKLLRLYSKSSADSLSPDAPSMTFGLSPNTSLDMTSAEMEAAITSLMLGKTAFGATPMGGAVKKIKRVITKEMAPKVLAAHRADQRQLYKLKAEIAKCGHVKTAAFRSAGVQESQYIKFSRFHKSCRTDEAVKYTSKVNCLRDQRAKRSVKVLRCRAFAAYSSRWGTTKHNTAVVRKGGSESVYSYITRLSRTFCGSMRRGHGILAHYLRLRKSCQVAGKVWRAKVKECRSKSHLYFVRKKQCNQYQSLMDAGSCKGAVTVKDACQSYSGCYFSKLRVYKLTERKTRFEVMDRKAEWRGLKRLECLIDAFADGKVKSKEIDSCKKRSHSTKHLNIKYPRIPRLIRCTIPMLYPTTGPYRRREFAPLPALAKGRPSPKCTGMGVVSLKPYRGSPRSCRCRRVNLNGHYSPGPLVKCTNCRTVRTSGQRSSCPQGTKIFAPASRADWLTLIRSAGPLRAPHWIIDVTRPQNGCGGCTRNPMNSGNRAQKTWRTSDGAPWWLRSTRYNEPNGDYNANCYLDLWRKPSNENHITFNDGRCNYHSKSYYCQPTKMNLKPKPGSPASCKCSHVQLTGSYSAGKLVKCEQCLTVYRSRQKNSCPMGMKIFSPASRRDWKTVLNSAGPLRAPHWIIDITRPQNGCGGCTRFPMRSSQPQQATWRTSDGSPWWLRSTRYNEPNGNYRASCYLNLWRRWHSENNVQFDDANCHYRSRSYYCQPIQKKKPVKVRPPPPAKMVTQWELLKFGLLEQAYYFRQGSRCPNLRSIRRTPDLTRKVPQVYYTNTGRNWPGFARSNDFAVRWSGILVIGRKGNYRFFIGSDDGSQLFLDGKYIVNNDGLHGFREKYSGWRRLVPFQYRVYLQMFERGGHAGMSFKWQGPDTGNRKTIVSGRALRYSSPHGWNERTYYNLRGLRKIPNLNRGASRTRIVGQIHYANTGRNWPGFAKSNDFAVRWVGRIMVFRPGKYRFQLMSDDGSMLYKDNRRVVNNDGLHGWRRKWGDTHMHARRQPLLRVEFFERGGHAGIWFGYMGPDTRYRMKLVHSNVMRAEL